MSNFFEEIVKQKKAKQVIKTSQKEKVKGKKPDKLTPKEKDELLMTIARMLGLID